ncbi:MAG: fatty acid synthase, partial [Myxococcota bacterium]
ALANEPLVFEAVRVSVQRGARIIEATASVVRDGQTIPVVRATATVAPPTTAYIFPGQGIQKQGMGMEGFARSAAARAVWERADRYTRKAYGYSILNVVRDNPKSIQVGESRYVHPAGVLNLTQFTQVSMAVLATAQMVELAAHGALVPGAVVAGHSVGEYNAICVTGIMSLEAVIQIVWHRGLTMHLLVPRDARGRSPYRMGVIRPHHAGLRHADVGTLVDAARAQSGAFIEVVNYNVRGKQYAVTGEHAALDALAATLTAQKKPGRKDPWVEVPGIDVPFHSSVLRDGVPAFRQTLDETLPEMGPYLGLLGRYVPNLVAQPFSLERSYFETVLAATHSNVIKAIVDDFETRSKSPVALARTLLIELLAWQFASPVRWIETQDLMLRPVAAGGLGVEVITELGVGYQPTAANMMRQTAAMAAAKGGPSNIQIFNSEADLDQVAHLDEDAERELASDVADTSAAPAPETTAVTAAPTAAVVGVAPHPAPAVGSGPITDAPVAHMRALKAILALQAKVRPEQITESETIDVLFDGVSSRRNQVLLDIGAEFQLGTIDGAHEQTLTALAAEITRRSPRWRYPGKYLKASQDDALRRVLGRAQMAKKDVESYLDGTYNLGPGLVGGTLLTLMLETREGDSARGGVLGAHGTAAPANKKDGQALVASVVTTFGRAIGQNLAPATAAGAAGGGAVDSAVVAELEAKILGKDGVLVQGLRDMAAQLGQTLHDHRTPLPETTVDARRLATLDAEHGSAWEALVSPRFLATKHVVFASSWAFAQRDVARLYYDATTGRIGMDEAAHEAARLSVNAAEPRVANTAAWFATEAKTAGKTALAALLAGIASGDGAGSSPFVPTRPTVSIGDDGEVTYTEVPDNRGVAAFVGDVTTGDPADIQVHGHGEAFRGLLEAGAATPFAFAGRTALITGASPNSIAVAMVGHLLRGGARVVVTTTTYNRDRILWYRRFYQQHAGPGAELHVVPFNQASNQDVDALITWLFSEIVEQDGAKVRVVKPAFVPDIFVPFAALKDMATVDGLGPRAEAAMRVMLLSVERLVGSISTQLKSRSQPHRPCHIVLPLSPNHGSFGGDGAYAETKAALEVLTAKWHSEQDAWGAQTTLCAAKIGWVRGTGLMDANNMVAPALEANTGAKTFSNDEMGWLLTGLCTDWARVAAQAAPIEADLTGGFAQIGDVRTVVGDIRADIEAQVQTKRRRLALAETEAHALHGDGDNEKTVDPLLDWPSDWASLSETHSARPWPEVKATLEQTVVIVGAGEVSPCGSSRTRFAVETLEANEKLAAPAVLELAWISGLIQFEQDDRGGSWVDIESGDQVAESAIADRYREAVMERVGIRFIEPGTAGFDPERAPVLATAWLDRDFTFQVQSESEARAFLRADPDHTLVAYDSDAEGWKVTRTTGAEIRVPREAVMTRRVAGMIPTGFDFARFGIPRDMVESVDRLALMNLIATVDAFISAGLTPEELLRWVHPARVANTQGSGIGGMQSMHRLYVDHLLGRERQSDVLQETLINVITGYAVQAYVGSYGSMSNPVAACATAAVSLESAQEKILAGKADFVVAGGFDDIGLEGEIGFADMNATCDTDQMLAMGLEPNQMSRSNDRRRRGFVGAQGGGTLLLARGDVALEMGLPVLGVLGYSGSFGDGIQKSVPAPGMGALACVMGGKRSAMSTALRQYGLTTDDIALVYKHDTSTGANDPNENALHDQIQTVLGRTEGNPLFVVSQKSLTGHSKGGAAAWQAIGLCQALATGHIAGNKNLESVDEQMRKFGHMAFTDRRIETGAGTLRAGLLTSLGFGHVSAVGLVIHPDAFVSMLDDDQRASWAARRDIRLDSAASERAKILLDQRTAYEKRNERRFKSADGSVCQAREETEMLLDPDARMDLGKGFFVGGADA